MRAKQSKGWVWVLTVSLVLTIGTVILGCTLGNREDTPTGVTAQPEGASTPPLRILLAGRDDASGLCDVLMLCSVDRQNNRVNVLQLPRDTFAVYDSGSYCKLNGALSSLGGPEELCAYLSQALALPIDRYLCMDLAALRVAVDAVGGVEITLDAPMKYEDPEQGLIIRLPAGTQVLDGEAAEHFVRYRADYTEGDLGRLDAQKLFLAAFFRTVRSKANLPTLLKLANSVPQYTQTNLTVSELTSLAKIAMRTDPSQMMFFDLPGKPCTVRASGASYFVMSKPSAAAMLSEQFGADEAKVDPNEVFCHHRNAEFCAIYGESLPYSGISMTEIEEKGIQIDRNP